MEGLLGVTGQASPDGSCCFARLGQLPFLTTRPADEDLCDDPTAIMTETTGPAGYAKLASYRQCIDRITGAWPGFVTRRKQRLEQGLFAAPAEKVAENILEDLLTQVLDWNLADVLLQADRADIVLSDNAFKRVVLEVKRPGALAWHRKAVEDALDQARSYAARQKVNAVAVSDGTMLYAADVDNGGGLRDRLFVSLDSEEPPLELWWLSVHGVYRECPVPTRRPPAAPGPAEESVPPPVGGELLHPKYHLPARCFAYLGDASRPATWKLPYRRADGQPDLSRLSKAVQAILSNYRGAKVTIPREAVPDVLVRLGKVSKDLGKMPCQNAATPACYREAHEALDQFGRLAEVGCCTDPKASADAN